MTQQKITKDIKENTDIHAVILAGPGHRLYPLIDESAASTSSSTYSQHLPKAILPIANRPMILWVVEWLLSSGVGAMTVVVEGRSATKIGNLLNKYTLVSPPGGCVSSSTPQQEHIPIQIDMLIMDEHQGTIAVMREVAERVKEGDDRTLLFIPCDFCASGSTNLLSQMADQHRLDSASLTCLFTEYFEKVLDGDDEGGDEGDNVVVGTDASSSGLVFYQSKGDLESEGGFSVTTAMLLKHPHLQVRTDLIDVHCYLITRDLILSHPVFSNPKLFSFREEAISRIVRHPGGSRVRAFCFPSTRDKYCLRANSIPSYLVANRTLAKFSSQPLRIPTSSEVLPKSQIGNDSLIGEHCRVGERTTVKRSVVGSHVLVGGNVKISNCVILDGCVIEDGVKLEGCVIGPKVIIKEKASLRECEVAGNYTVERELACKGEVLGASRELQSMFD